MYLKNIRLVNFKNFDAFEADFSPKINTLTGPNGTGKTNILDAVYYLCFTKSYFSAAEGQNIRHGEDFMMLEGNFCRGEDTDPVLMSLQRGAKKSVKRCGKPIDRMSEYAGLYPLVIVSPSDSDLIAEGSSQRRKFIDGVIAQTVPGYLNLLTAHARVVEQRNALLKRPGVSPLELDVYDLPMVELGQKVHAARKSFLEAFVPVFRQVYTEISGGGEQAEIAYRSVFDDPNPAEVLAQARPRDLALGFSTVGVHKDDLRLTLDGYPVKNYGSQGQQKTFLTALKLAQFRFMTRAKGEKPILLLDDVFDKLDSSRVQYILSLVRDEAFGQIFLSDTHPERIEALMEGIPHTDYASFHLSPRRP